MHVRSADPFTIPNHSRQTPASIFSFLVPADLDCYKLLPEVVVLIEHALSLLPREMRMMNEP
jgi:hypothetical protein